jgi:hypothetical protein
LPAEKIPTDNIAAAVAATKPNLTSATPVPVAAVSTPPTTDRLTGTVILHNANWKANYLTNQVMIAQATLHLNDGALLWDPVVFSYGPVKGTATLTLPTDCEASQPCLPEFHVEFGALNSSAFQAALLGAHQRGTLLATLLQRLHSSPTPSWPQMEGTVKADSLLLGPLTLREATATLRVLETGVEITSLDANLLGGRVHGTGTFHTGEKSAYTFETSFEKLNPQIVGQLFGQRWTGKSFDANGKIDLSGFTGNDLAASAKGTLHFDWLHGAITAPRPVPAALVRFDRWTSDAVIQNGAITLQQNQLQRGAHTTSVETAVVFGTPPKITFAAPRGTPAKR